MKIFRPTYIALAGFLIMSFIFLIPPKRYDPETGEEVRRNNFSFSQIIAFIIFVCFAIFTLYSINCLNHNHHILQKELVKETSDLFSKDITRISKSSINELYKKSIKPDNNCIKIAWIKSVSILAISIIVFSIGYSSKFIDKPNSKTSLFDQLAK